MTGQGISPHPASLFERRLWYACAGAAGRSVVGRGGAGRGSGARRRPRRRLGAPHGRGEPLSGSRRLACGRWEPYARACPGAGNYKSADKMIFDRPQRNAGAPPPDRAAKQRRPHRPPLEKLQNFLRRCAPSVAVECRCVAIRIKIGPWLEKCCCSPRKRPPVCVQRCSAIQVVTPRVGPLGA